MVRSSGECSLEGTHKWPKGLTLLALKLDREDTIEVLEVQSERPLAVLSVGSIVRVVDDLPEVDRVKGVGVQPLAGYVTDRNENAVALG